MLQSVFNALVEKAEKKKKDGVYVFDGHTYAVKDSNLVAYSDFHDIYQVYGWASVKIKSDSRNKKKDLKEVLKQL